MEALERVGKTADYLSMHMYVGNHDKDTANFLAVTNRIDAYIEKMNAVCIATQARLKSDKRAFLCFDEWNVWYKAQSDDGEWKVAPRLIEEVYNLEDALVCAGFLNSFIRHADMVKIANIAQVVNVIAPILTDGDKMLLQSSFYAIEMYANRRDGVSLKPVVKGPTYVGAKNGEVTYLDSSAVLSSDGKKLHVFAVNRSLDSTMPLVVDVADMDVVSVESADILTGPGADAANSYDDPNVVIAKPFSGAKVAGGKVELNLPPLSFVAMTLVLNAN
jgi:alpha-N-arabinofuranosidase